MRVIVRGVADREKPKEMDNLHTIQVGGGALEVT